MKTRAQANTRCIVTEIYPSRHPSNPSLRTALLHLGEERDMRQIVVGDHYSEGQLGFFIPEGSIVPDKLADEMLVLGRLGGKKKNRVLKRRMDGVLSDGLFYGSQGASWNPKWIIGQDVTEEVGVIPPLSNEENTRRSR